MQQFLEEKELLFFPASSQRLIASEVDSVNTLDRSLTLKSIDSPRKNYFVVTFPEAIMELSPAAREFKQQSISLSQGEELSMDDLVEHLNEIKFERSDFVYQPGQFSWRGGIIDVFSYDTDMPYRLEFAGNKMDSIRQFDIETQLSQKELKKVVISPDSRKVDAKKMLNIIDNLPGKTLVIAKDLPLALDHITATTERLTELSKEYDILSHAGMEDIVSSLDKHQVLESGQFLYYDAESVHINSMPQPAFNKNFDLLADNLRSHEQKEFRTYITASDANQVNRFYEIFEDIGKDVHLNTIISSLHEGFVDMDHKVLCYTDHQIFGRYHKFRLRESFNSKKESISLKELMDLQPGDFITHIDHGVGKFSGLEKIDVNGKTQEAIRIIYKNNDVLYISIHSLHRISKYVGKDGTEPKMDKLGSNAWKTLKSKTKKRVKELAFDLIKLYAERKAKEGFAFSPDSYLQTELEASFIYEDTPDQFKATQDVKADMEASYPMDRLVCGDVGFGKTEIAIRAAFKAVNDSKQVAILVPTTILAMQHFKTFRSRLEQFPCKIDYLNRFRSSKDERRILQELAEGKLDIVIGTHKLLSEKVKFKDLGLMIIDEEQKVWCGCERTN